MEQRNVAALLAACAALALATPALAVDRTLGADVPRPVATGAAWSDADVAGLDAAVDAELAGAKTLRGAHAAIYAIDARDGRVLYARNADDAFQPASTLKLLVGSAALDRLGPAFRFRTEAVVPGYEQIRDRELSGALLLRGSGDVLLDDKALDELPSALRLAGIDAVHGVSFIDDLSLPAYLPGWSWDDLPWYYAAPVTPLGLNDNQVTLNVTPGAVPGARVNVAVAPWGTACTPDAICTPELGFTIYVRATTGLKGTANTLDIERQQGPGAEVWVVGSLPAGGPAEHLSIAVPWPPRYAAWGARRALQRAGFPVLQDMISAPRPQTATPERVVWTHWSEPLGDMLADLWLPSDNILAEELLRAVGAPVPPLPHPVLQGSSADGIAFEKTWLKGLGVDTDAIALEDGSGLSVYDRITPRDLVVILKHDWDGPNRNLVLDDLPIAGVRGTLKSSFTGTPAERHVFAKTGSLSHVSALAGYVANAKHGAVIIAFQVDDWVGASAELRELRGRVLAEFVER